MLRYYVNLKVSCQNDNMEIFLRYVFFQFHFFQYIITKKNCCICNIFSFLEKKKWPPYPTPHSFPTHLTKTPFPQHFPTTTTLKTLKKDTPHSTKTQKKYLKTLQPNNHNNSTPSTQNSHKPFKINHSQKPQNPKKITTTTHKKFQNKNTTHKNPQIKKNHFSKIKKIQISKNAKIKKNQNSKNQKNEISKI